MVLEEGSRDIGRMGGPDIYRRGSDICIRGSWYLEKGDHDICRRGSWYL